MSVNVARLIQVTAVTTFVATVQGCGGSATTVQVRDHTDAAALLHWNERLAPALADLERVSPSPLVGEGNARIIGCRRDEGELTEAWAGKEWIGTTSVSYGEVTPQAREGYSRIASQLIDLGWTSPDLGAGVAPGASALQVTEFSRTRSDYAGQEYLTLQLFEDGVIASLTFDDAPDVCRG